MKKKRQLYFLIFILSIFFLCALDTSPESEIVATVNGIEITIEDINQRVQNTVFFYNNMTNTLSEEQIAEKIHEAKFQVLEQIIQEQVVLNEINRQNISATAEIRSDAEKKYTAVIDRIRESVLAVYPDLDENNLRETVDMVTRSQKIEQDSFIEASIRMALIDELKKQTVENVGAIEELTIQQAYDEMYLNQKAAFDADLDSYEKALLSGKIIIYRPVDTRVFKLLEVFFDSDVRGLINQLNAVGSFEQANEMIEDQHLRMTDKSFSLIQRLQAGESFEDLMEENLPGSSTNLNYITEGSARFSDELKKSIFALRTVGDVTEPIMSENGFILAKWVDNLVPLEKIPLEEVKNEIEADLLDKKRDAFFEMKKLEWQEKADIKIFPDRIN